MKVTHLLSSLGLPLCAATGPLSVLRAGVVRESAARGKDATVRGRRPAGLRDRDGRRGPDGLDFEDLFENGGIPCHIADARGIVQRANRAELDLLGVTEREYLGRDIAEFHADGAAVEDILARLRRGETVRRRPARLRVGDGTIRDVEITASGRFRRGRLVGTRCFTIDIAELTRARDDLRRKEEAWRKVLDVLPAAVYTTDATGKLAWYNRAAAELAGREPEIGRDAWCVTWRLRTPDGAEQPFEECPMAVALREDREVRGMEGLAERPDGTLVPFLPFPTPLHDGDGRLVGAVNMLVDISERKQAETRQRMLLEELNHRVKNNMQMLHGLLQSGLRETDSVEAKAVLRDATQRVRAMAAAQQLLYSDNNARSFSIARFLHAVCDSVHRAFDGRITISASGDRGRLSNDVSMPLALILNELLTGAARQEVDGIAVDLRRTDDEVVLSVAHDGPGFGLPERTKRASGLGLVRGLARQLGGTFETEQTADGTRCAVRFPASRGGF